MSKISSRPKFRKPIERKKKKSKGKSKEKTNEKKQTTIGVRPQGAIKRKASNTNNGPETESPRKKQGTPSRTKQDNSKNKETPKNPYKQKDKKTPTFAEIVNNESEEKNLMNMNQYKGNEIRIRFQFNAYMENDEWIDQFITRITYELLQTAKIINKRVTMLPWRNKFRLKPISGDELNFSKV